MGAFQARSLHLQTKHTDQTKDSLIRRSITAKIFQPTWFEFSDLVARFVRWVAVRLMTMAEKITLSTDCRFKTQAILDKTGSRQGKINLRRSG